MHLPEYIKLENLYPSQGEYFEKEELFDKHYKNMVYFLAMIKRNFYIATDIVRPDPCIKN